MLKRPNTETIRIQQIKQKLATQIKKIMIEIDSLPFFVLFSSAKISSLSSKLSSARQTWHNTVNRSKKSSHPLT
jgi:hypothetical protein